MTEDRNCNDCLIFYLCSAGLVMTIWLIIAFALIIYRHKRKALVKVQQLDEGCEMKEQNEENEIVYTDVVISENRKPKKQEDDSKVVYSSVLFKDNKKTKETDPNNIVYCDVVFNDNRKQMENHPKGSNNEITYMSVKQMTDPQASVTDLYASVKKQP